MNSKKIFILYDNGVNIIAESENLKEIDKLTRIINEIENLTRHQIDIVIRNVIYDLTYQLKMEDENFEQKEFLSRISRTSINLFIQALNGREFNEDYLGQYYSRYKK